MHRLRGRRKGNKEEEGVRDGNDGMTTNTTTSGFAKTFKRNKSQPPPVTRQPVDLTAALPSRDDFRISLLMPNLEQRFSVLRESENEGKAGPGVHGMGYGALASGALSDKSDQSGDFSKPPFGNAGLQDITETASITSSGRGRSVNSRKNSQSDDPPVGIMNRPRAGEGNVLFGGRQKVFRVNTAASKPSNDTEKSPSSPIGKGMGGRALLFYDDVPTSSYAVERRREREAENPRSTSPSLMYNNDRNTSSSLGSNSLARSSTAATSITSHSNLNYATSSGSTSKPRRLIYEQGLDRDLQEQNNSTHKLEVYAQRRMGNTPSPVPSSHSDEDRSRPYTPSLSEPKLESSHDGHIEERSPSPKSFSDAANMKADLSDSTSNNVFGTFDFGIPLQSNSDGLSVLNYNTDHGLPTPRTGSSEFQPATENKFLAQKLNLGEPSPLPSPLPEDFDRDYRKAQTQAQQKSLLSQRSAPEPNTTSLLSPSVTSDKGERRTSYESSHPADASFLEAPSDADSSSNYGDSYYSRKGSIEASRVIPTYEEHYNSTYPQPGQALFPPSPSIYPQDDPLDSPTLPSHGGLSSMIRQHLRSDSGISSIYALSIHPNRTEVIEKQDPKSPTFNDWDTTSNGDNFLDREYQESLEQPRGLLTLAELKRRDALIQKHREKTLSEVQMHMAGREYERPQSNRSNDDWQNELAQRRMVVQQKLHQQSGRNSPNPSQSDLAEDQSLGFTGRNGTDKFDSINKGSQVDTKATKPLGVTNQHKKPSNKKSHDRLYISQSPSREDLKSLARPSVSSHRTPPNLPNHIGHFQSPDRLINGNMMHVSPQSSAEVLDDLRPPHDRAPPQKQRRPSPPQIPIQPQQSSNSTQYFNSGRNRSNDDFQAPRSQPRRPSNPNEHFERTAKNSGDNTSIEAVSRKNSQDAISAANMQSRFSLDDSPTASTFAGRLRSNSKALGRVSVPKPDIFLLSPSQTQMSATPSTGPSSPAFFEVPSSNSTTSLPYSPTPLGVIPQNTQTLADMHNTATRPTPNYQNQSSSSLREIRKLKVKKSDISNPKLEHTTSQMPSSILIEAGPGSKAPSPPVIPPRGRPGPGVQGIIDNFTNGNSGRENDNELSRLKKSASEGYSLHSKSRKDMARVPILVDQMPGGMI